MMKHLIALAALVLVLGGVAAADDGPVPDRSRVCMVQDVVMDKPGIPVEHRGKTYFGCCAMCSEMIAKEPERHTRARDPITGADIDKADAFLFAVGGRAYYFETEGNRRRFEQHLEAEAPPR